MLVALVTLFFFCMAVTVMPDRNTVRKMYVGSQFHGASIYPGKEGVVPLIARAACRIQELLTSQWFRKQSGAGMRGWAMAPKSASGGLLALARPTLEDSIASLKSISR